MIAITVKIVITVVGLIILAGSNHPAGPIGVLIDLFTANK